MYYGFVWNNPCIGKTEFAKNLTMFSCEATKRIDYLVMYGKIPADVVKKACGALRKPPLLLEWAFGFWQSK
jgi:alpha-D-xyloside xylohydrolase